MTYLKKNIMTSAVVMSFLTSQLAATHALAQFEDLPPPPPPMDDFSTPPPPPPPGSTSSGFQPSVPPSSSGSGFNSGTATGSAPGSLSGSGSGSRVISPSKGGKNSILSEKQKQKFAKAAPEDITSENFPETIESFDFPNVEITDIIKAISELTGKNFIIDSSVRGKITIIAPSKITVAEAYKAFLSSLAINGYTVVPSGGFLKIRNARSAQRDGIDIYSGAYYPNADQMITKVIHVKHISADEVKQKLGRVLTSNWGELEVNPQTNSLIISDFGTSIDRIMKIINQLDVPGFEEQLEVVGIKYAKAKDIADLIDKVVNKGQRPSNSGGFNAGTPRFSSSGGAGGASGAKAGGLLSFMVFPDDRTNSLIIVGNRAGIARVKKLIAQLDYKVNAESQGGVYVYYVKYGEAEKIAATLSEVAKDSAPKQPTQTPTFGFAPQGQAAAREGLFGGDVSIRADKNTNSIVISASKQDYDKVLNILTKLDIARHQVFVEAIIMEMAMIDGMESSGGIVKFNSNGGKAGFAGKATDLADILSPLSGAGSAILGFSQGSVSLTNPLKPSDPPVSVPNLIGYLKFIKQFGKTNILSTPQITAMDSQPATIEVGDKVVTGFTAIAGANGAQATVTPTTDDATIKLTIKPFISPSSDIIRLELKQSVKQLSQVKTPAQFEGNTQPLATRSIETNVVLRSGDTAVIGGLMKDEVSEKTKKVPLLGDLPILGWLFKAKEAETRKVNMLAFLSPQILRNPEDQQRLLTQKTDERLRFLKQNGGKDPYGATVDKILKRQVRTPQSVNSQGEDFESVPTPKKMKR